MSYVRATDTIPRNLDNKKLHYRSNTDVILELDTVGIAAYEVKAIGTIPWGKHHNLKNLHYRSDAVPSRIVASYQLPLLSFVQTIYTDYN